MEAKKKILLVEDDEVLASVYRARLEMEEFEVVEVHDGEQALTAALKYRPDLILLDAMMPKISGFDCFGYFTKYARNNEPSNYYAYGSKSRE